MVSTYWVIIAVVLAAASVNGENVDGPIRSLATREISGCQRVGKLLTLFKFHNDAYDKKEQNKWRDRYKL